MQLERIEFCTCWLIRTVVEDIPHLSVLERSRLPVCVSCLLHVTFPVLVDMQRSANTAYTRSVDLWPVLSPLHAHLAFYLKTSLSRWALARVSIVCLLPWSRSVVLLLFFSLAWMSLIQPDSYITFPVPSDIPSSHISMSKHTHLPLPLSWIDSGLCPPTFPPFSPSPSRVSPRPLSAY